MKVWKSYIAISHGDPDHVMEVSVLQNDITTRIVDPFVKQSLALFALITSGNDL